jgi:phage shock protein E
MLITVTRRLLPLVPGILYAAIVLCGCTKSPADDGAHVIENIGPDEARARIDNREALVLDVRTDAEFNAAHIDGAIHLDIQGADFDAEIVKLDKSKQYIVHCATGVPNGRSYQAAAKLNALGVKRVFHLDGGLAAYRAANHPVVRAP